MDSKPVATVSASLEEETPSNILSASYWTSIVTSEPSPSDPALAEDYKALGPVAPAIAFLNNYFRIKDRGSTFWIEFCGGMTTCQ